MTRIKYGKIKRLSEREEVRMKERKMEKGERNGPLETNEVKMME